MARVVKQGDSARLECKVSGSPEMKIVWFRNDHEIIASEKFRTSFIDSVAVLEMNHLSTDESGDYICEAHNPAGKASCSTKVTVKGQLFSCSPVTPFFFFLWFSSLEIHRNMKLIPYFRECLFLHILFVF